MKQMEPLSLLFTLLLFVCPVEPINAQQKEPLTISPEEKCKKIAELKLGEASGTIKGRGETFQIRYAYARWVKHSLNANEKMIDLLLTERPIPTDKLASVFAYGLYTPLHPNYEWLGGALRGIRFHLQTDGHTVYCGQTHSNVSVGGGNGLDEVKLAGDQVSGTAQEKHFGLYNVPWSYSLSFVAAISK